VAYSSLLQEQRRALHAQIVSGLETLLGGRQDEQVEILAHHALRGEVWDKAITYYRQVGARASSSFPTVASRASKPLISTSICAMR
jgi:predicted ATPase